MFIKLFLFVEIIIYMDWTGHVWLINDLFKVNICTITIQFIGLVPDLQVVETQKSPMAFKPALIDHFRASQQTVNTTLTYYHFIKLIWQSCLQAVANLHNQEAQSSIRKCKISDSYS